MYKKDYLQRQLEEFGMVMAVLFGLRKNKDLEAHKKEFALAFNKYTAYSPDDLEPLPQDMFIQELKTHFGSDTEQLHMLADLLYEKLNFYLETDEIKKTHTLRLKCMYLYSLLQENLSENEFNLDIHYRLNFLEALDRER
jgi:hypothetical protein